MRMCANREKAKVVSKIVERARGAAKAYEFMERQVTAKLINDLADYAERLEKAIRHATRKDEEGAFALMMHEFLEGTIEELETLEAALEDNDADS